jgi:hypothetical protein
VRRNSSSQKKREKLQDRREDPLAEVRNSSSSLKIKSLLYQKAALLTEVRRNSSSQKKREKLQDRREDPLAEVRNSSSSLKIKSLMYQKAALLTEVRSSSSNLTRRGKQQCRMEDTPAKMKNSKSSRTRKGNPGCLNAAPDRKTRRILTGVHRKNENPAPVFGEGWGQRGGNM